MSQSATDYRVTAIWAVFIGDVCGRLLVATIDSDTSRYMSAWIAVWQMESGCELPLRRNMSMLNKRRSRARKEKEDKSERMGVPSAASSRQDARSAAIIDVTSYRAIVLADLQQCSLMLAHEDLYLLIVSCRNIATRLYYC